MASFRSGIKIISDVSKRQGRALLQRSLSSEQLAVALRRKSSSTDSRSVSPNRNDAKDDQPKHMTDVVAAETPWFSPFIKRQEKPVMRTLPLQPAGSSQSNSNKFLVPNKGPQQPNRYLTMHHCIKDPPKPYVGPAPDLRDCHKKTTKSCFMETFLPKVVEKKEDISGSACSMKGERIYCEHKSQVRPFSVCPKPIPRKPMFSCPEVKCVVPEKKRKLEEEHPKTYIVCGKPPVMTRPPMCVQPPQKAPPKPPPTPRRCICANDVHYIQPNTTPLYKMNPEIPFPVCHKNKYEAREIFQWPLTNIVCKGIVGGSCSKCGAEARKSAACQSIQGETCAEDHPCPYRAPRPPSPPQDHCGPSRPTFPTGPPDEFRSESASITTYDPQRLSSSQAPGKVRSMTSTTNTGSSATLPLKRVQSLTSAPTQISSSISSPKSSMSTISLQKAVTTSNAGSVSQRSKSSSNSSNATPIKQLTKLDCATKPWNVKPDRVGKCAQHRWPGCRVAARVDCNSRTAKKNKCIKIRPPTPCFSECYKRVQKCKTKKCRPCPCVKVEPITECDVMAKIRHLQPKEPIFMYKQTFVLPPPTVELFVDPSIGACCESTKTPAPAPIPCPRSRVKPPPIPFAATAKVAVKKKGSDCSLSGFFKSLVSFLKGDSNCPTPPNEVKKAAKEMENTLPCPTQDVCKPNPKLAEPKSAEPKSGKSASSATDASSDSRTPCAPKPKTSSHAKCSDMRFPGCSDRVREDCTIIRRPVSCTKRLAPRPSFSECVRNDFPKIKCTECRISLKRAKSLSELREKGIRVTPENLRVHCSMCLRPTTRGCETVSKQVDCFKLSHRCQMASCSRVGVKMDYTKDLVAAPMKECKTSRPELRECDKAKAEKQKDCKNMPKSEEKPKNLPCNPQDEQPANNPVCENVGEICEASPSYKMPK